MRTHVKILAVFFLVLAMCFSASKGDAGYLDPYTYEDIDTFDSTWLYNGVAYWSHAVPADFDVLSAEITLEIRVNNYSEVGALDLLCSNTNNFGFWDPYTVPHPTQVTLHAFIGMFHRSLLIQICTQ